MGKIRLVIIVSIIAIAAIAVTTLPVVKASSCCSSHGQKPKMDMKNPVKAETLSPEKTHSGHLPMVSQSIDKAIKAIEAGNKETALAELYKAQKMLAAIKGSMGKHAKAAFANVRCPIMGSPINPAKVTKNLIREHKGQKVAFCCGGCPSTWEKLSDVDKDAKLAKVRLASSKKYYR